LLGQFTSVARWYIFRPKITIWVNLEGLAIEDVGIFRPHCLFYCEMVYFVAIWYILWAFGICHFGMLYQEKSGNPAIHHLATLVGAAYVLSAWETHLKSPLSLENRER
jgi:hypothetical protein